ncbi:hypothetical protein CA13_31350 [Planctomycetes bacterium CA13]|uniref:Uncharacterized protein n=1 Tax=Novipirellula herctigrandis TaxID=2527986 RepID=A0A5C5Z2S1_9BACT|nr:hypothetical protein CA13_31350 [Planctomycetes bacterium CA13]
METDRRSNFRFSLTQLLVLTAIVSLFLWLNTFREITCVSYAAAGRGDALRMRQGWPLPFLHVFEWADGTMGPSRIADGWPPTDLERDFLITPFIIDMIVWLVIIFSAIFLMIRLNRVSVRTNKSPS